MSSELRLEATDEEFSTFLRETCGIETNSFTVRQARNGDDWERRGGPRCVDRPCGSASRWAPSRSSQAAVVAAERRFALLVPFCRGYRTVDVVPCLGM